MASSLLFVNDVKILIEVLLRECVDMSWDEIGLVYYLSLLDPILQSEQFTATDKYRRDEILIMLQGFVHRASVNIEEALEGSNTVSDSVRKSILEIIHTALLKHIDILDWDPLAYWHSDCLVSECKDKKWWYRFLTRSLQKCTCLNLKYKSAELERAH